MIKVILISITVIFYISLCIELFLYRIPSVVVTKKILNPKPLDIDSFSKKIKPIFQWHLITKVIVFVIPLFFIFLLHLLPLINIYQIVYYEAPIEGNTYLIGVGIPLILIGRLISHKYLIDIKRILKNGYSGFVKEGSFRLSRNPGLLGLYISFLGFYLIKPTVIFFLCYIIYLIHMHFKVLMEEDYLTTKHSEAYKNYKINTRRYL